MTSSDARIVAAAGAALPVRVTLMLVRSGDVLLSVPPLGVADAAHALPTAFLTPGESFTDCAARLASGLGLSLPVGVALQHFGNGLTPDGAAELRVGLTARVAADAAPPDGWAFHPATALPRPLDWATSAVVEACLAGEPVRDSAGAALPVELFPGSPRSVGPNHEVELPPPPPEPEREGPTVTAAGAWFGGALLWVSSVLLVVDELHRLSGPAGPILWLHGAGFSWYACTQAGSAERLGRDRPVRRAIGILAIGLVILLAAAVVVGMLGPAETRVAYVMLGFFGIPVFWLAEWRARRRMPKREPDARTRQLMLKIFAVFATLVLYTLGR